MKNIKDWKSWEIANTDPYGKACIDVARKVIELLEEDSTPLHVGYYPDINTPHGLICKADKDINAGGITGAMAGFVAQMVSHCSERGDEFKKIWNTPYNYEGDKVINPAFLSVGI
jgi:hypothetical protein